MRLHLSSDMTPNCVLCKRCIVVTWVKIWWYSIGNLWENVDSRWNLALRLRDRDVRGSSMMKIVHVDARCRVDWERVKCAHDQTLSRSCAVVVEFVVSQSPTRNINKCLQINCKYTQNTNSQSSRSNLWCQLIASLNRKVTEASHRPRSQWSIELAAEVSWWELTGDAKTGTQRNSCCISVMNRVMLPETLGGTDSSHQAVLK